MAIESVRVGLIGAGRNTHDRHIPGFNSAAGVEIGAVANRSRESGQRVADAFNIPTVYDNWEELLEDESLDAVCIGTWPYMHRTLTMASLEAGKHVLCEARMAMNAAEAHEMLAASQASPNLVAQIVPSPMSFGIDDLLIRLISEGFIGDLVSLDVQSQTGFTDRDSTLHWRQDRDMSGFNILNMGIWYEAMIRWVGRATQVMAMSQITIPHRRDDDGNWRSITVPDTVDILCRLANGANAHLKFSACAGLSPRQLRVDLRHRGDNPRGRADARLRREARRFPVAGNCQPAGKPLLLVRRAGVHRLHPRRSPGDAHPVQHRRALHGMDRSGHRERTNRRGGPSAAVARQTHWKNRRGE